VTPADDPETSTADGTSSEAWEQIMRLNVTASNAEATATRLNQVRANAFQTPMRTLPLIVGDDAQCGRCRSNPFGFGPGLLVLLAPDVALLCPIPDEFAWVETPIEDFLDRGRRPACQPASLWND
jgi:hypothetical protein